jgi:hypothetical protein
VNHAELAVSVEGSMKPLPTLPPTPPNGATQKDIVDAVNHFLLFAHGHAPLKIELEQKQVMTLAIMCETGTYVPPVTLNGSVSTEVPPPPASTRTFLLPYRKNLSILYSECRAMEARSLRELRERQAFSARLSAATHGGLFARNVPKYTAVQLEATRTTKNALLLHRSDAMTSACIRQEIILIDAVLALSPARHIEVVRNRFALPDDVVYVDPLANGAVAGVSPAAPSASPAVSTDETHSGNQPMEVEDAHGASTPSPLAPTEGKPQIPGLAPVTMAKQKAEGNGPDEAFFGVASSASSNQASTTSVLTPAPSSGSADHMSSDEYDPEAPIDRPPPEYIPALYSDIASIGSPVSPGAPDADALAEFENETAMETGSFPVLPQPGERIKGKAAKAPQKK